MRHEQIPSQSPSPGATAHTAPEGWPSSLFGLLQAHLGAQFLASVVPLEGDLFLLMNPRVKRPAK